MTKEDKSASLAKIPASRHWVSELYANGLLNNQGRQFALNILYPNNEWGLWISRLLLTVGSSLVLSGIIYFFAYNWSQITPFTKFAVIQGALVVCLISAWFFSIEQAVGQTFLLASSILVGVFMAVFGQIYQTGADAYQLFMMWSLFILGWTVISNFNAQWIVWLVVTNLALGLWWKQAALPSREMEFMIFIYGILLNGAALFAREYLAQNGFDWLKARWTRVLLTLTILTAAFIPTFIVLLERSYAQISMSLELAFLAGIAVHIGFLALYRFKIKDIWVLSLTTLSVCALIQTAGIRFLIENVSNREANFLLGAIMTIALFTSTAIYLRKTIQMMGASHD